MKGSIFTLILFGSGCIAGAFMEMPDYLPDLSVCILYFMMLQVGINIGRSGNLKEIINTVGPKVLLIPIATITGTLLFSALTGLLLSRWSIADCMAVGSGMGYYSLSSVLITQLKTPSLGIQLATELGTIAGIDRRSLAQTLVRPFRTTGSRRCHYSRHYYACYSSRIRSRTGCHMSVPWSTDRHERPFPCEFFLRVKLSSFYKALQHNGAKL